MYRLPPVGSERPPAGIVRGQKGVSMKIEIHCMDAGYLHGRFVVVEYIDHYVFLHYASGRRTKYNDEWYEDLDTACTDVLPRLVYCGFKTIGG